MENASNEVKIAPGASGTNFACTCNFFEIRADPASDTEQGKQKVVSIWEGSELVPGGGMNLDHSIRPSRGRVRADPRRQDQLVLKNRLFRGRVPAGPSRQD